MRQVLGFYLVKKVFEFKKQKFEINNMNNLIMQYHQGDDKNYQSRSLSRTEQNRYFKCTSISSIGYDMKFLTMTGGGVLIRLSSNRTHLMTMFFPLCGCFQRPSQCMHSALYVAIRAQSIWLYVVKYWPNN